MVLLACCCSMGATEELNRAVGIAPGTLTTTFTASEDNWLVAIGVNRFDDKTVVPLRFCAADAEAIYTFFTSSGFVPQSRATLLVTEAGDPARRPTRNNILEAIQTAATRATTNSTVLLSFSGHGFVDSTTGVSYVMPEDGDAGLLADTAIPVTRIVEILAGARAARRVLLVDACRITPRSDIKAIGESGKEAFLQSVTAGSGLVILASCRPGQFSSEMPTEGHGAFTQYLLQGLKGAAGGPDGAVTNESLHQYLSRSIPEWCRQNSKPLQEPWMAGEIGEPILLATRESAARAASQSARVSVTGQPPSLFPHNAVPPAVQSASVSSENRNFTEQYHDMGLDMVWVQGGTFEMGSPASVRESDDERPAHQVVLDGFWLGRTEVTQGQYEAVMGVTPANSPDTTGPGFPVYSVSWNDAMAFCRRLSSSTGKKYTLPTEAQWEYACRAGTKTPWFFGGDPLVLRKHAWYFSERILSRVAEKKPNPWGFYDMYGNVWEWCLDWYGPYDAVAARNPMGPPSGSAKVVRGGSYNDYALSCRSARRSNYAPDDGVSHEGGVNDKFGFRIVRIPE